MKPILSNRGHDIVQSMALGASIYSVPIVFGRGQLLLGWFLILGEVFLLLSLISRNKK